MNVDKRFLTMADFYFFIFFFLFFFSDGATGHLHKSETLKKNKERWPSLIAASVVARSEKRVVTAPSSLAAAAAAAAVTPIAV